MFHAIDSNETECNEKIEKRRSHSVGLNGPQMMRENKLKRDTVDARDDVMNKR